MQIDFHCTKKYHILGFMLDSQSLEIECIWFSVWLFWRQEQ